VVEPLVGGMQSNLAYLIPPWKLNMLWLCEATKKIVWLRKFLMDLGVMRMEQSPITLTRGAPLELGFKGGDSSKELLP
jgi:hypothetical protein